MFELQSVWSPTIHWKYLFLPDLRSEVETSSHEYRDQVRDLNKEERKQRLNKIQELFKKAMEYSDDKVQIAMQMYEMVSGLNTSLIPRQSVASYPGSSPCRKKFSCMGRSLGTRLDPQHDAGHLTEGIRLI